MSEESDQELFPVELDEAVESSLGPIGVGRLDSSYLPTAQLQKAAHDYPPGLSRRKKGTAEQEAFELKVFVLLGSAGFPAGHKARAKAIGAIPAADGRKGYIALILLDPASGLQAY